MADKNVQDTGLKYGFAVYGTQGGGLAKKSGNRFIFVEEPDCPGLTVGDMVPKEWDIIPANDLARHEDDHDQRMPGMGF